LLCQELDSLNKLKYQYENQSNDTLLFDVVQDIIKIHTKKGNLKTVDTLYMDLDSIEIHEMDLERQSNYYTDKVQFYGMRRNFEEAKRCVEKAISINQAIKDTSQLISNYGNLASIQMMTENLKEASITFFSVLDIATSLKDSSKEAQICSNLSGLYYKLGSYNKGIEYANRSIQKTRKENHASMAKAYTNLSINLYKADIVTVDSVISIMRKTINLYENIPDNIGIARETNNIGTLLWKASRFMEALPYLKKAEKNYLSIDKEYLLESNYISQGKYYNRRADYSNAELYFNKALDLNQLSLNHKIAASEQLGNIYSGRNQLNLANNHYAEALILKDSLYNVSIDEVIFETEAKYKNRIVSDSLIILEAENQLKAISLKQEKRKSILLVLFLLGTMFLLYRILKKYGILKSENSELIFANTELKDLNENLEQKIISLKENPSKNQSGILTLKSLDKLYNIKFNLIKYIKAEDEGVRVFFENTSIWSPNPMKSISIRLPEESFIKIYRSTIVNIQFIQWVNHITLLLRDGTELKIGRTFKEKIINRFKSE